MKKIKSFQAIHDQYISSVYNLPVYHITVNYNNRIIHASSFSFSSMMDSFEYRLLESAMININRGK